MAHDPGCAYEGIDAEDIEAARVAGTHSGMGLAHLSQHVEACPRGCRPLADGELPPLERYQVQPGV